VSKFRWLCSLFLKKMKGKIFLKQVWSDFDDLSMNQRAFKLHSIGRNQALLSRFGSPERSARNITDHTTQLPYLYVRFEVG
jgi:hypothetical protein